MTKDGAEFVLESQKIAMATGEGRPVGKTGDGTKKTITGTTKTTNHEGLENLRERKRVTKKGIL